MSKIYWLVFAVFFAVSMVDRADAQVYVTGITAAIPDPADKVPKFDAVQGSGIATWSNGLPQTILIQDHYYNYCVSIGSVNAAGSATVSYRISRGTKTIESGVIVKAADFKVGKDGIWFWCSGYTLLPKSPGGAVLTATVEYFPTKATKGIASKLSIPVVLQ